MQHLIISPIDASLYDACMNYVHKCTLYKQTQNKLLYHFESSEWREICEIMANDIEVIKTPAAQIMTDIYHQSMQDLPTFIKNTSLCSSQTHGNNKLSKSFEIYQSAFTSLIYAPLHEYVSTKSTKFEGNANDLLLRISEVVNIVKKQAVMKNCGIQFDLRYPTKITSDDQQDVTIKEINSCNDDIISSASNSVATDLFRKTKISMIDITKSESFGQIIQSKLRKECNDMSEFDYSRYELLFDDTSIVKVFSAMQNNTIPAIDIRNIPLCRIYNSTNSVQSILDYISAAKHQEISHMMTFSIHIYHGQIEIYFHLYANGKLYGSRMFEDDLLQIIPKLFVDDTVKDTISIHDNFKMNDLVHDIQFNHPTKYQKYNLMLHKQHTLKGQKKRIYKSKKDAKKRKEQRERFGQMALQNLIDRQVKEERKLQIKSGANDRMTRHKSLYLAQTRYKCAHCDIIIQDIANLSSPADEDNLHVHKCYASPYDKKHHNLSLQWLSVNTRSAKCQFNHSGPCLSVYTGQDKQRQAPLRTLSAADKRKQLMKARKFGTADDLTPSASLSNLRDLNFYEMYDYGLVDSADVLISLDPKNEKKVLQKLEASWKKPLESRKNTADNDIILSDKSFWDDILSSDSSDTEDASILYKRKAYPRHKKQVNKKFDSDFGASSTKLFTPNPNKNRLSFQGMLRKTRNNEKVTTIDFRKKKDSVFLNNDDVDGTNNNNTIQRNKLPNFRGGGARKSRFGVHDTKPLLQGKNSSFKENAYGEIFKVNQKQKEMIESGGLWPVILRDIEEFGVASFDRHTPSLKLVLSDAGNREHVIKILEEHLGCITADGASEKSPISVEKASRRLIFPLTDRQLKMATNEHHLKMLMDDMIHFGSVGVDGGFLKLNIPADLPTISPIHKLEKRLGVLLTIDEVNTIRDGIRGEDKLNEEQGIDIDEIDVLKLNDRDFVNHMMNVCEKVKFTKHKKRGVYDERYLVIHNDRLFWKEKQDERNHRSRSMHLTKIIKVMTGKMTKALKHETLDDIPPQCCFSVVAKKATLDLSASTRNPIEVRIFTAYLKGLQRHFITQQTQFMSQTLQSRQQHSAPNGGTSSGHNHHKKENLKHQQRESPESNNGESGKLKLSPIGTGFGGFRFDDDTVQQTQQTKHRGSALRRRTYHKKEAVKDQLQKPQKSSAIQREGFIDNKVCPECGNDADELSKAKQRISEQKRENQQLLNTVERKNEIIKQKDSVIMEQKSEIEHLRQQIQELQTNVNPPPSPPFDAVPYELIDGLNRDDDYVHVEDCSLDFVDINNILDAVCTSCPAGNGGGNNTNNNHGNNNNSFRNDSNNYNNSNFNNNKRNNGQNRGHGNNNNNDDDNKDGDDLYESSFNAPSCNHFSQCTECRAILQQQQNHHVRFVRDIQKKIQNKSNGKKSKSKALKPCSVNVASYDINISQLAGGSIFISRKLTDHIIPLNIKGTLMNPHQYVMKTVGLQLMNGIKNDINCNNKIINLGLSNKRDANQLFVILQTNDTGSYHSYKIMEKLFTASDLSPRPLTIPSTNELQNNAYRIEYIFSLYFHSYGSIGISMRSDKQKGIKISGVHLDWNQLRIQHQLIMNGDHIEECHCFDGLDSIIHDIHIGNPDDVRNMAKDYQTRYIKARDVLHEIEDRTDGYLNNRELPSSPSLSYSLLSSSSTSSSSPFFVSTESNQSV